MNCPIEVNTFSFRKFVISKKFLWTHRLQFWKSWQWVFTQSWDVFPIKSRAKEFTFLFVFQTLLFKIFLLETPKEVYKAFLEKLLPTAEFFFGSKPQKTSKTNFFSKTNTKLIRLIFGEPFWIFCRNSTAQSPYFLQSISKKSSILFSCCFCH